VEELLGANPRKIRILDDRLQRHCHLGGDCRRLEQLAAIGRAGLVGTQNIRNNQSRVGGLDCRLQSGIMECHPVAQDMGFSPYGQSDNQTQH
jgi:hypothetical protein